MEHQGGIFMTKCICNKLKQYMMLSVCLEFLCILHTYEKNCISRTNYRWL